MISIKKSKKKSKIKNKIKSKKKLHKYNSGMGGENATSKICKGRTKEQCNDGTGDCKFIDGAKRKYCKRTIRCKKSCGPPCEKMVYNNKMYCIPPNKEGNKQTFDDVKDILSELLIENTDEKDEEIVEQKSDDDNLTLLKQNINHNDDNLNDNFIENIQNDKHNNDNNSINEDKFVEKTITTSIINKHSMNNIDENNNETNHEDDEDNEDKVVENKINPPSINKHSMNNSYENSNEPIDDNNEEKGSVASILYSKSAYDKNTGSCTIL